MQCKLVIDVERGVLHVEAPQELAVDLLAWVQKTAGFLVTMAREAKRLPAVAKGDATDAAAVPG